MHLQLRIWLVGVACLIVGGAIGWAATSGLVSATDSVAAAPASAPLLVEVVYGSVGRTINVSATATQPYAPVAANGLAGTITSRTTATTVSVGDMLYSVNEVPVRVLEGAVPFYRGLQAGDFGTDVMQLTQGLNSMGLLADSDIGNQYTPAVVAAVSSWQQLTGSIPTGAVANGTLMALNMLPASIQFGESIQVGLVVSGGENSILARTTTISFKIELTSDQAKLVKPDLEISLMYESFTWPAFVAGTSVNDSGNTELVLKAPDGGIVCGGDCEKLPADEQVLLAAELPVVAPVTGPVVPAAAIHQDASGQSYVIEPSGARLSVLIEGADNGIVVVKGVEVGQQVQVFDSTGGGN